MAGNNDMVNKAATWLAIIGGLNWGLVGAGSLAGTAGGWNVVDMALGSVANGALASIVYVLVGLGALWLIKGQLMK